MDWTHRLRLRNLQMISTLAHTGNISRSAQILHTTQPHLSRWLKELEEDIGLPLFERGARGLSPTTYGRMLIAHAIRLEAQLDHARDSLALMRAGGYGRVHIGVSRTAASELVPAAILRLLEMQPKASIMVVESTTDRLIRELSQGALDIVVGCAHAPPSDPAIRAEKLYLEPIVLVARPDHPIFRLSQIDWDALLAYRLLLYPSGSWVREAFDATLKAAGRISDASILASSSPTATLYLLNRSDMISVVPLRTARYFDNLKAWRIIPWRLATGGAISIYSLTDAVQAPAIDAMLNCLRQQQKDSDTATAPSN